MKNKHNKNNKFYHIEKFDNYNGYNYLIVLFNYGYRGGYINVDHYLNINNFKEWII